VFLTVVQHHYLAFAVEHAGATLLLLRTSAAAAAAAVAAVDHWLLQILAHHLQPQE
jgi:hypothetical protein